MASNPETRMSDAQAAPVSADAPGAPAPNTVAKTPNPFLLFVEVAAAAVVIGLVVYHHVLANLIVAGIAGILLGFGVIVGFNITRLRYLLIAAWAVGFGMVGWYYEWHPILIGLAALLGASIKIAEMVFLARFRE